MAQPLMKFDVRSNVKQTLAELRVTQSNISNKAQVRALNRTIEQLRTEAGRKIREEYNVTLRGIRQASKITRARAGSRYPSAELTFRGRPINLYEFGARQVKKGVTVKVRVRGARKLIASAFIQTLKSGQNAGKRGVFKRTGKARYPIHFLPSLSLPVMAERKAISAALLTFADERFSVNFDRELRFLLGK